MPKPSVAIVGAGAAGLAAADILSAHDFAVTIFEARDRVGGRIHTIDDSLPIELGAEFIHGDRNETWHLASQWPEFRATEVPDHHWEFRNGELRKNKHFWDELGETMEPLEDQPADGSFASFLQRCQQARAGALAQDYVEGFHAANPANLSIKSLAQSEKSAEETDGQKQFHIASGYSGLMDWLATKVQARGVTLRLEKIVREVRWQPGAVQIQTTSTNIPYHADMLLVTVPLAVLQAGAITFSPELEAMRTAVGQLRMGNVLKLILRFRQSFWPKRICGFIHAHGAPFPTWWIDERGPVLTGWAGGPKADAMSNRHKDSIIQAAVSELARIFSVSRERIEHELIAAHHHDWRQDPFTRGAYSYVPVGMTDIPELLAEPVADTIYFAGEATASAGETGTVHGAIGSGRRAADQMQNRLATSNCQDLRSQALSNGRR